MEFKQKTELLFFQYLIKDFISKILPGLMVSMLLLEHYSFNISENILATFIFTIILWTIGYILEWVNRRIKIISNFYNKGNGSAKRDATNYLLLNIAFGFGWYWLLTMLFEFYFWVAFLIVGNNNIWIGYNDLNYCLIVSLGVFSALLLLYIVYKNNRAHYDK